MACELQECERASENGRGLALMSLRVACNSTSEHRRSFGRELQSHEINSKLGSRELAS